MWTKEKIKDFARDINYHHQSTSGELSTLHTILADDEDCFGMTEGMMKKVHSGKYSGYGIALLTDKRFLFYHKGFLGSVIREEFPLNTISSITFNKGILFGSLHVYAANVDEIIIQPCDNNNAGRIAQVWQHLLNERNIFQTTPANEIPADPVAELEKWHNLKERGLITEEEYNSMKKQILGL
ncbi:MAG TPA: PH domain-containing protein [Ginsengibacter sp.]